MRTKPAKFVIVLLLVVAAAVVFTTTLVHSVIYDPDTAGPLAPATTSAPLTGPEVSSSSYPARIVIPSLAISANVQHVGVNAAGNMQAPNNFTDAAWYDGGPVPGETGSAVIDGHVDNGLALAGVFKHLDQIKVGDDIFVFDEAGHQLRFEVMDIELYPYQSVPSEQLFDQNDAVRLNLITCDGAWVAGQRTYDHRLVIYSVLKA